MNDGFQYGDILFLGLIAVFILLRLRAMLGKNEGIDPRELWKQATRDPIAEKTPPLSAAPIRSTTQEDDALALRLKDNPAIEEGLKSIKAADATFNAGDFIAGAKLAFEWVVNAFSRGDKDKLRTLLNDERFQSFAAEIDGRAKTGMTQENTLVSILNADITEARIAGAHAYITLQFTSEQVHVTRDPNKTIVAGDPSHIERVIDVWTFERDTSSRDPNWKITAT